MKVLPKVVSLLVASSLMLGLATAQAYPKQDPNPYNVGNLWELKAYNDDSTAHRALATHKLCFSAYTAPSASQTHIKGKWYSTTFPNWNGLYAQEGDSLKILGNYANGVGNDGAVIDIVSSEKRTVATGQWTEWRDTGMQSPFNVYANVVMTRIGSCKFPKSGQFTALKIQPRFLTNGAPSEYPMQENLAPVLELNEYEIIEPKLFDLKSLNY